MRTCSSETKNEIKKAMIVKNSLKKYLVTQKLKKNSSPKNLNSKGQVFDSESKYYIKNKKVKNYEYVVSEGNTGEKVYSKQRIETDYQNIEEWKNMKDGWINVCTPNSKINFYSVKDPSMQQYTWMTSEAKAKKKEMVKTKEIHHSFGSLKPKDFNFKPLKKKRDIYGSRKGLTRKYLTQWVSPDKKWASKGKFRIINNKLIF